MKKMASKLKKCEMLNFFTYCLIVRIVNCTKFQKKKLSFNIIALNMTVLLPLINLFFQNLNNFRVELFLNLARMD